MKHIVALHKHWVVADAVKQMVGRNIRNNTVSKGEPGLIDIGNMLSMFARLSVWYALLYVVIEGYKDLGLKDPTIDELLKQDEYVNNLRLFRNAMFHFQADPLTEKSFKFLESVQSETWIQELNNAFEELFLANLPIQVVIEELKRS